MSRNTTSFALPEARVARLRELISEGLESGEAQPMTDAAWSELREAVLGAEL